MSVRVTWFETYIIGFGVKLNENLNKLKPNSTHNIDINKHVAKLKIITRGGKIFNSIDSLKERTKNGRSFYFYFYKEQYITERNSIEANKMHEATHYLL